jgi:hypothetical protein
LGYSKSYIIVTQHIELFNAQSVNKPSKIIKVEKKVYEESLDWLSFSLKIGVDFKFNP